MKTCRMVALVAGLVLAAGAAQADSVVTIETVHVGNPGNAADTRYATPGYGSVAYEYNIGKYEVTAGQYCAFLNSVGGVDTYGRLPQKSDRGVAWASCPCVARASRPCSNAGTDTA